MLSKSRILSGLQCPKRLYLEVHRPELAEDDPSTAQRLQVGHEIGALARALERGGRLIAQDDLAAALQETKAELARAGDKVLFEGTFSHAGVLVRADILSRRRDKVALREVKSSTRVTDYHYADVAVQAWTLRGAGVTLSRVYMRNIDNTFVYRGDGAYAGLFRDTDLTGAIGPHVDRVSGWVESFTRLLEGPEPDLETGSRCGAPFDCPFREYCAAGGPAYPVEILPRGGKRAAALREAGYRDIRDVPAGALTAPGHVRVWRATKSGVADIVKGAGAELKRLPYPRYYVDFETTQMAVPIWTGTRLYEQLPFQWSCHVEKADGSLEHRKFLDLSGQPPTRAFAESLIAALGTTGPVFSYSGFESKVLRQCASRFLDLAKRIDRILKRIVDLHPLTERSYYHPQMMGSWSIKSVIPTIAPELDYAGLGDIQDGGQAQYAYLEAIHPDTPPERKQAIGRDLERYCAHDTIAMVRLANFLMAKC